jgi:hypothetical protein
MSVFYRKDLVTDQKLEKRLETEADLVDGKVPATQLDLLGKADLVNGKVPASQLPTPAPQAEWIAPTLINSWININSPENEPAGYYKDEFGIVRLRGWISNGTSATAFVLPVGFRPEKISIHAARGQVSGNFLSLISISINNSTGNVSIVTTNGVGDDTVGAASLSGITFRSV